MDALMQYWKEEPYDNAIRTPYIRAHNSQQKYKMAFKFYSEYPTKTLYIATRLLGTKKIKKDVKELRFYVGECKKIGEQFAYFMNNEWIFDNASAIAL